MSSTKSIPQTQAIQIVQPTNDHAFELKIDVLEKILNADGISDRNVVVISVVGALRQGKSFLLNFYLQYLNARYKRKDVNQFLSENAGRGFNWRGGSKPETNGILMWPELFTYDYENGEKVAIILLDTQGSFDNESSVRDCSTIFALSAMLSSVLCYNVMRNIREDDLQHRHLFTEYGKIAVEESEEKPFQKLLFIVRDWSYAYEHDFGWNGGNDLVNDRMKITHKQTEDMKNLRTQLNSSFDQIQGFLMPYPGESVAQDQHFSGNLEEISSKFKNMLKELIPKLFSPENLLIKKVHGQKVRAKDLIQYLKSYVSVFNGKDIPEPKSIFEATAESYNLIAYLDASSKYADFMRKAINEKLTYFKDDELKKVHDDTERRCKSLFTAKPKIGGAILKEKYLQLLCNGISKDFNYYLQLNQKKKQQHIKKVSDKLLAVKSESVSKYSKIFEEQFGASYMSKDKLNEIHLKIKKQAIDLFKSKLSDHDDAETANTILKQLENELEITFKEFQLKNSEKEKEALEAQKKKDALVSNQLLMEMRAMRLNSTPAPVNYYSPPSPMCYNTPSFDSYSSCSSNRYSPAPSNYSSSSSTGTRRNYTQNENARLQSLFDRHGNNYERVARDFNSSRGTTTQRSVSQIQSKCYRMRRNGDIE